MTQQELAKHYRLVEQAIQILEQHSNDTEPTLTALAHKLHISPAHLQRVFTAWAGISPKLFFRCLQKDHARKLIQNGHSNLSASIELGLTSTSKLHNLMIKFEALSPGELKSLGKGLELTVGHASSPFGRIYICTTPKGINSLEFETNSLTYEVWCREIRALYPSANIVESNQHTERISDLIFAAHDPGHCVALNLLGTPFQLQVWQALIHLPVGHLATYQQVARTIGKPKASRAVGSAIAKNPVGLLIPCHRVIQATGELGQYRWNSTRKKALHIWEQGLLGKHNS